MPKLNRVAYLSYDGLTDPLGQSQIIPYIIGLAKYDYHFTIYSFEKPKRFIQYGNQIETQLRMQKIEWRPLRYTKWPPVLSTILDVWKLWRLVKESHLKKNFNIIHCRSYITSMVGLKAKRKYGTKFIFDMRGFWADERVEGGLWNLMNPLYKVIYSYFKKKEKQFLAMADHVIALTENAKLEMHSWRIKCPPITVIPTCVDLELFNPSRIKQEAQLNLRLQLGIKPDDFILLYLGSWGTWYLTNEMLEFFTEQKKVTPSAKFMIVTPDQVELNDYEYRTDLIVTRSPRELIPLHISISDLAVCFIKPTYSKKASSATKLAEVLAMNVPVITNRGWGDVDFMFDERIFSTNAETFPNNELVKLSRSNVNINLLSLTYGISQYNAAYKETISSY